MTKRQFVTSWGSVLVLLPATTLLFGGCDDDEDDGARPDPDSGAAPPLLMFVSSVDQGHRHTVTLETATLDAPPTTGVSRDTSVDGGHSHMVMLTEQDLRNINAGQTVTKAATSAGGHTHTFMFARARA